MHKGIFLLAWIFLKENQKQQWSFHTAIIYCGCCLCPRCATLSLVKFKDLAFQCQALKKMFCWPYQTARVLATTSLTDTVEFKVSRMSSPQAAAKLAPVHVGPTSGQLRLSLQFPSCQATPTISLRSSRVEKVSQDWSCPHYHTYITSPESELIPLVEPNFPERNWALKKKYILRGQLSLQSWVT